MRQLVSTALVAVIVASLAAVTVSTLAQTPRKTSVNAAAVNADTVDRLSAVEATNNKEARKNKLVATDEKGFLPANIVKAKWALIAEKPAFLADAQIGWNEISGIPARLRRRGRQRCIRHSGREVGYHSRGAWAVRLRWPADQEWGHRRCL